MNANDILKYGHYTVLAAIDGLDEANWTQSGACGTWSIKDLIAHLASYEQMLVEVLTSVIDPTAPTPTLNTYTQDIQVFNDTQVASRRLMSVEVVVAEYTRLAEQTQALVNGIPKNVRDQEGVLPWYGADYDLDDFLVYTFYGHKREHCAQIAFFRDALLLHSPQLTQRRKRHSMSDDTALTILSFHEAFNAQIIDTVMQLMTPDCIFENTYPAPDGTRYAGHQAVRQCFIEFFQSSPHAHFDIEELFVCGDRGVIRWIYRWHSADQAPGHVRGVDIFQVRDHKVVSKLSYVKG